MIGSLKRVLLWRLFLSFFERRLCLYYSSYDESDGSEEEKSGKLGSESGSDGTFSDGFGGLFRGGGFFLSVMIFSDESCNGDGY